MANTLYISATAERSGKSAITLGLMRLLIGRVGKVGFFRHNCFKCGICAKIRS